MNESNQKIEDRVSILETEVAKLKAIISPTNHTSNPVQAKKMSIKEFLITKAIDNDVKRTLAIAYFMEKYEGMQSFNTDDLKKYFNLAKHPVPANSNDKVNMNIKGGFMMEAEEKKDSKKAWMLTASGEKVVEDNFILTK
jgi:hypothetical protein